MLIVDSITDELRDRVKKARPALVWGLLLGKRDGVDRILEATHLTNTSEKPAASININYSLIAKHLQTLRQDDCEVFGYYYSCTEQTPVPTIIERLPFPTTYYVLRLVSTPTQFRWEAERVDKITGDRTQESVKKGSLQQIERHLQELRQSTTVESTVEQTDKPITLLQRLTAFASKLYRRGHERKEPLQPEESNDTEPVLHQAEPVAQLPERPSSPVVISPNTTKLVEYQETPLRQVAIPAAPVDREVFSTYRIRYLYHMTHRSNLQSILQRGLLSHNAAHRNGYVRHDIADSDVVQRRSWKRDTIYHRSINDYAPLYFNPKNPMLYKRREVQDELVILGFDPVLLFDQEAIFCDGNAAATDTNFYNHISSLERLSWQCIHANSWNDITDGRRIRCAEVLVYPAIQPKSIRAIFCRSHQTLKIVQPLLADYPHIRLCIDYSLYF